MRARTVIATEPMMHQPTCAFERPISARTTGIKGAIPNHAKKQRKNASHDRWNARIGGVDTSSRLIRVARPSERMGHSKVSGVSFTSPTIFSGPLPPLRGRVEDGRHHRARGLENKAENSSLNRFRVGRDLPGR